MKTAQQREAKLRLWMRRDIGFVFLAVGLVYLFGPRMWQSSGNFVLLRALGIPIWVWAGIFALGGLALLINLHRWNWVAYLALTVTGLFWAFCQLCTLFTGTATGGGGPFWVFGMSVHAVIGLYLCTRDYDEKRHADAGGTDGWEPML